MIAAVEVHHAHGAVARHRCPLEDDGSIEPSRSVEGLRLRIAAAGATSEGHAGPTPLAALVTVASGSDPAWRDLLGGTGERAVGPTGIGDVAVDLRCPDSPVGPMAARLLVQTDGRLTTTWLDPAPPPSCVTSPRNPVESHAGTAVTDPNDGPADGPAVAIVVDAPYRELLSWLCGGRRLGELVASGHVRIGSIPLISFVTALLSSDPRDGGAPAVDPAPLLAAARISGVRELAEPLAGHPTPRTTITN